MNFLLYLWFELFLRKKMEPPFVLFFSEIMFPFIKLLLVNNKINILVKRTEHKQIKEIVVLKLTAVSKTQQTILQFCSSV